MTRDDRVLELLGAANPVSDPDRFAIDAATRTRLETIEQWSGDMQDTKLPTLQPSAPRSRRGWLVAAAAAVVVLVVGFGSWAVFGGPTDDEPVIAPGPVEEAIPLIGADGDTAAQEAFASVQAAFAAHNSGDLDTWYQWREGDPEGTEHEFEYELAVGGMLTVEQCTYRGFQEWRIAGTRLTGHGFDCAAAYTDRLFEPAGIRLEMTYNWVIGEDPWSSLGTSNEFGGIPDRFASQFRDWLAATHPEVAATIEYADEDLAPGSVPTALEYIDEFVAQSVAYPLTVSVPEHPDFGGPLE